MLKKISIFILLKDTDSLTITSSLFDIHWINAVIIEIFHAIVKNFVFK